MSHPVPACPPDRLAGLQGLFDKADLLVVTPSPPTLGAQHIDLHSRRDLKARRNSNELDKRVREKQRLAREEAERSSRPGRLASLARDIVATET